MGYNTTHTLSWTATKAKSAVSKKALDAKVGSYIEKEGLPLEPDGSAVDACKWYEHEDDMREMSKKFKSVLFHLQGEGESSGDIWDAFFLNGKTQHHEAKVVRAEAPDDEAWV